MATQIHKLDASQQIAFDQIGFFLNDYTRQEFFMGGLAGTGKSTILGKIAGQQNQVVIATPTGKASYVMMKKCEEWGFTGIECMTIHSLLYQPIEITEADIAEQEETIEKLRAAKMDTYEAQRRLYWIIDQVKKGACHFIYKAEADEQPLVIVDEASMVTEKMQFDLAAVAQKILYVGDHGQLPPVGPGKAFFDRNKADVALEKIHRQGANSSILRFAHAVRNGQNFNGWDENCRRETSIEALRPADQIITGKNESRRGINQSLRQGLGFEGDLPNKGERVICLQNDHGRKLINGVHGVCAKAAEVDGHGTIRMDVDYDGKLYENLGVDPLAFRQYAQPSLDRQDIPKTGLTQFDFGHAITAHKAQGSEWDHVAVYDDKMRTDLKAQRRRWMYTSATRAAKTLTWVDA